MKNKLKIFYVSPEVAPFASSAELGEVAGSLPKALKDLGHEVRMMMPNYRTVNERKYVLRDVIRLKDMAIAMDGKVLRASGKSAFLPNSKVQIYFLDYKPYFDRPNLYVETQTGMGYADNAERFVFFCRGCLETLKLLHWQPDVIHCNDWQTCLIPYYLKTIYRNDPFFKGTRVLLSVHDATQHGQFDQAAVTKAGFSEKDLAPGGPAEFYGKFNFLKAGLFTADLVTTVSETYAHNILTSREHGRGLEEFLRGRRVKIVGVMNGVDYSVWNPETDTHLAKPYSANDPAGKFESRRLLLKQLGLKADPREAVIGMISILREEKGIDLVIEAFDKIISLGAKLVILGVGDETYHKLLMKAAKKHPKQAAVIFRRDEALTHLLLAGADMLLMAPRLEPCESYQLYAMAYGTIPVVRATGGLADTVENYNVKTERGTGIVFTKYSATDLLQAVHRALKIFADDKHWLRLMRNAMKQNYSWQSSAEKYVNLYHRLGSRARR